MIKLFHHLIETEFMNSTAKNKLLVWLVVLLLVANAASIAMFWMGKRKPPPPSKGSPIEFLIKELKLDTKQQEQFELLKTIHRNASEKLREKIKESKESFFDLLQQPTVSDSTKQAAANAVSVYTKELDLLTLNHFQKLRELCTSEQQQKFDEIIHQVTNMMGQPRPPMHPSTNLQGPPGAEPDGDRPPPPEK